MDLNSCLESEFRYLYTKNHLQTVRLFVPNDEWKGMKFVNSTLKNFLVHDI